MGCPQENGGFDLVCQDSKCDREDGNNCVVKEVQRVWKRAGFGGAIQTGSVIRLFYVIYFLNVLFLCNIHHLNILCFSYFMI
jgi:hypothetical protein